MLLKTLLALSRRTGRGDQRLVRNILLLLFALTAPTFAAGRVIVVVGAEGEPEYGQQFAQWAARWTTAARASGLQLTVIGQDTLADAATQPAAATRPATTPATQPASDKDALHATLHATLQADAAEATGPLWLVLIGHGTSDGREAKFNLRGPDVTDKELADWLRPMKRPIAVINCASASGPFLNRLSAVDRVVITATRAGSEYQFARFGDHLSAAVADTAADLDKDGQTSLLEAFLAASRRVEAFYKQNGRIVTEHALLDDNGDGLGVSADWFQGVRATRSARSGAPVDGLRAQQWFLMPSAGERALSADDRTRRDRLEAAIEALRQKKASMAEDAYYAELETLMVALAGVYR